ncbi:hypothetical protein KIPB_014384, partial [Kipferlia bialata]
ASMHLLKKISVVLDNHDTLGGEVAKLQRDLRVTTKTHLQALHQARRKQTDAVSAAATARNEAASLRAQLAEMDMSLRKAHLVI